MSNAIDLNALIVAKAPLLSQALGEMYPLTIAMTLPIWKLNGNVSQVEQALFNLVTQAREAMPDGGHIRAETANVTLKSQDVLRHLGVRAGDYVMLSVTDLGLGLTPEIQEHVFEPFFTLTKFGQDTGLRLATCHSICKQNGGAIEVKSTPGEGSTFKLYLPRFADASLPSEVVAA